MFGLIVCLIHINDLPVVNVQFNVLMYADDTTLYANFEVFLTYFSRLDLGKINRWFMMNKLFLNIKLTR